MGKLIATEFVSIDGVFEEPQNWTMPYFSEAVSEYKNDDTFASDALLLGRTTYEGFAAAWPSRAGDPFADRFNSMPKYVVSTSLKNPEWNNSHIVSGDLATEIPKLKSQHEQAIAIHGSGTLVNALLSLGLIDEYHLMAFPVVLGSGRRLFNDGVGPANLQLVDTKSFRTGVVVLTYSPGPKS